MTRTPIYGLDAVRFFAAASVLVYHIGYKAFALPDYWLLERMEAQPAPPPWAAESWWGWIGVQIFFVISGLVISYSIGGGGASRFVQSRIARLFPGMLVCASLILPVAIIWEHVQPGAAIFLWLKSITFFPIGPWLSGQFWTLAVEVVFYGLVWLMICFRRADRLETLAWTLAIASAAYWLAITFGELGKPFPRLAQLLLLEHGCHFALGIVLFLIDRSGLSVSRGLLCGVTLVTAWPQIADTLITEKPGYGLEAYPVAPFAVFLAAVAVLAISLHRKEAIAGWLGRRRLQGAFRFMGLATYPLYLIHMHTAGPVLVEAVRAGAPPAVALGLAIAAASAATAVVVLLLEPPARRWTTALLQRVLPAPRLAPAASV